MNLETLTYTAPASWASYVINGDASGLDDDEHAAADAWLESLGHDCSAVDCEPAGFRWRHDAFAFLPLGAECERFVFLVRS